jgi:hypothetical protein
MTIKHLERPKQTYDDFTISDDDTAAPVIVSRQISRPAVRKSTAEQVLIPRETLDKTTPTAKAVLAILCWANSIGTTALTGMQIQNAVHNHYHPGTTAPIPIAGIVAGFVLQVILTAGQAYTAERSVWGYRICLAPDAALTAWQWGRFIMYPISIALLSLVLSATWAMVASLIIASIVSWMVGVYSAKLPERMVFGQRRKG